METENIKNNYERAEMTRERRGRKKIARCKNPECDYTNEKKITEHFCPKCGWITENGA